MTLVVSAAAVAVEVPRVMELSSQDNQGINSDSTSSQMTSVSHLSDVQPTDWAFRALQSLVERYGCFGGYPDRTYRGNRALSRYEFAVGLNTCLNRIAESIEAVSGARVSKEDLVTLQKLKEEFAPEIGLLRGRVDTLEAQTAILETQQFSTTTKLYGEAIFGVVGVATGQDSNNANIPRSTTFGDRVRLNLDTSFSGKDLLRVRLQAFNFNYFSSLAGTRSRLPEGILAFDAELGDDPPEQNRVTLDRLYYRFPVGKTTTAYLFGNEGEVDDFVDTVNPFLDSDEGSRGAMSRFGSRNSVYYFVPPGTGIGIRQRLSKGLELDLGYLSNTANDPSPRRGLFNGSYAAIAQFTVVPNDRIKLGLTYVHGYNNLLDDLAVPGTGSKKANLGLVTDEPVVNNAYGLEASFLINSNFFINGWVGYAKSRAIGIGDANIWNYAVALAFPDLGGRGNLVGIIVGMEPKVTSADRSIAAAFSTRRVEPQNRNSPRDRDTSIHVEAFYTYAVSDNIAITPGVIWITDPNHDARNDDLVLGVIRTTFFF